MFFEWVSNRLSDPPHKMEPRFEGELGMVALKVMIEAQGRGVIIENQRGALVRFSEILFERTSRTRLLGSTSLRLVRHVSRCSSAQDDSFFAQLINGTSH